MRAKFTKEALVNYASMVEKYGDIYVNELGQVTRSKDAHETKYQDEKRKVPAVSCMYAHLNRTNLPRTVEQLEKMFVEQTASRANEQRLEVAKKTAGKKTPDVVKTDAGAFERLTNPAPEGDGKKKRGGKDASPAPEGDGASEQTNDTASSEVEEKGE